MHTKRAKSSYKNWKKYGCSVCNDFERNNNECPFDECQYADDLDKYENYKAFEREHKVRNIESILGIKFLKVTRDD